MNTLVITIISVVLILAFFFFLWKLNLSQKEKDDTPKEEKESFDDGPPAPEESLRDSVTHLYNRKHLLRRLQEHMALSDRKKETFALVLWDIDGFVEFNNRYSRKEGDEFLKRVADTIRKSIRIYDEAFRSGSDEFCAVLLPGGEKVAHDVTKRVSQIVERELFQGTADYANERFSISYGVVFYPSQHKLPEALLYAAGEALYKSQSTVKPS